MRERSVQRSSAAAGSRGTSTGSWEEAAAEAVAVVSKGDLLWTGGALQVSGEAGPVFLVLPCWECASALAGWCRGLRTPPHSCSQLSALLLTSCVILLKRSGLKVRFCTNESQKSRGRLVEELRSLGFDISEGEVTAPPPAACRLLKERSLRPHLLVHDEVRSEFDQIDTSNPNCVVIADAAAGFSYENMNKAFQVLMGLEDPVLISLGQGRYYKATSGLMLDVGGYMKALEFACGIQAEVVGKPAPEFFKSALREMGLEAHEAIMIGDDIVGDVGGAQRCGMRALQVRTGKFRPSDEHHPEVKADGYVDNLAEAVDLLLQHADK
ncbi:PREDICTED: phospholysine phosphohistidine inorganic pyrophosphate phosphatase [Miniopterus natalensis]|uniref:phospholysine phosphohistidine inorganic pyrophosphate phosphatase n=1 Tax=Miniopterus natalensis TaxID=291302 RepID=UPI0007A6D9E7|nr:PREDICTED: phospholysine phosphohistidine inorganic pyrophosphate phosphatase [Miniopterus natalensis]